MKEPMLPLNQRFIQRAVLRKMRDFSGGYIRFNSTPETGYNPCNVNDGALLDLKNRSEASTHARRCPGCNCPLYRDELHCPLCGQERAFFGFA